MKGVLFLSKEKAYFARIPSRCREKKVQGGEEKNRGGGGAGETSRINPRKKGSGREGYAGRALVNRSPFGLEKRGVSERGRRKEREGGGRKYRGGEETIVSERD